MLPLLPAAFAEARSSGLSVQRLGDDIAVISGAGGNVVVAGAGGDLVMVDGGLAKHSKDLLATIEREFRGRKVATLFNTHWHPEQTGSNLALARKGATIVSHANTRLWLGTDIQRPYETEVYKALPAEARPDKIFYDTEEFSFGTSTIRARYMLQAHTDGDIYVYFPEANVLAAGGAVSSDRWPLLDWWTGGWMGGLVEGLETMLQVSNADTRIVPADGPVMTRAELQDQRDMYADLFLKIRDKLLFAGLSPDEAVAAQPAAGLKPEWGSPDRFIRLAFQSYWGYYTQDA